MTNNKNKCLSKLLEKQTSGPTSTTKGIHSGSQSHKNEALHLKAHSLHFGDRKKSHIHRPLTPSLPGVLIFIKFFLGILKTFLFVPASKLTVFTTENPFLKAYVGREDGELNLFTWNKK